MGMAKISTRWTGEALNYMGIDSKNNQILLGGQGTPPTQMLLLGLAGCMGMDVLSILQKKRQAVTGVEVQVTGYNQDEYPKPFHTIEVAFIVKGDNIDSKAVERAIELSMTKYCIVGQTLQHPPALKTSFTVQG